jgi:large subunit ribosomal protein L17
MLRTMVTDLIRHESLQTTEAKAKEIRRMTEKVISYGKAGGLHNRRLAAAVLTDDGVVTKLFDELGSRYEDRPGGYTRVIKMGPRKGDAAPMAVIELME